MIEGVVVIVILMSSGVIGVNVPDDFCTKVYLEGLNELTSSLPLWGVYEHQNFTYDNFPVFRRQLADDIYIYRNKEKKTLLFQNENRTIWFFLGAVTTAFTEWPPQNVISYQKQYPFDSIIQKWYYYDPVKKGNYVIDSSRIRLRCLEDGVDECSAGKYEFSETLTHVSNQDGKLSYINIKGTHYYEQIPGVYYNQRPVYQRKGDISTPWYMSYVKGFWQVSDDYSSSLSYIAVKDGAMRPEFIAAKWSVVNGRGSFTTHDSLKLNCKGFESDKACEEYNPCVNSGRCRQLSSTEIACKCPSKYIGDTCEVVLPKCPTPHNKPNSQWSLTSRDITLNFCNSNFYPPFYFSICEPSSGNSSVGVWKTSVNCTSARVRTTQRPWYSTRQTWQTTQQPWYHGYPSSTRRTWRYNDQGMKRYNSGNTDDIAWLFPTVLTLSLILQLLVPIIVYIIMYIIYNKSSKETESTNTEHICLTSGNVCDTNASQNNLVDSDSQKHNVRLISCGRYISLVLFISFWIWFLYLCACMPTKCARYGELPSTLVIMAITIVPLAYLYIILESCCSNEKEYIANLADAGTVSTIVSNLRSTQPYILMRAVCYHYEIRTRTVSYTDANGNMQTRLETYTERVVTHYDTEFFNFNYWKDQSDDVIKDVERYRVTKIKMYQTIMFGDMDTENACYEQYELFKDKNSNFDIYMDTFLDKEVPGYKKRMAAFIDPNTKPWWMGLPMYWLSSVLCFTWPYRWLFRWATGSTHFNLTKTVYMTQPLDELEEVHNVVETETNCVAIVDSYRPDNITPLTEPIQRNSDSDSDSEPDMQAPQNIGKQTDKVDIAVTIV